VDIIWSDDRSVAVSIRTIAQKVRRRGGLPTVAAFPATSVDGGSSNRDTFKTMSWATSMMTVTAATCRRGRR
jgi:hypothetical protein